MIRGFKPIVVRYCRNCRRYFNKNKWVKASIREGVKTISKTNIKGQKVNINPLIPEHQNQSKLKSKLNIYVEVELNKEHYFIPAIIMFTICKRCSREKSKYYEGILQLRKPTTGIINYVKKELEKLKQKGVFITKEEKVKNGFDFYITDKKAIMNIGKKLKQRFTGQLKISPKLQTIDRKTSKLIYRTNVLFKRINLKKDDVIKINNKEYRIKNIGNRITVIESKTGKKVSISLNEVM